MLEGKAKKKKPIDPELKKKLDAAKEAHMLTTKELMNKVDAGEEHWVEVYDSEHDAFYYYGSYTGEMTWEKPEHYVMAADDDLMHAVITIQKMWRGKVARGEVQIRKREGQKWTVHVDEGSGVEYYWNSETGECVWEKPAEFVAGGEEPAGDAAKKMKDFFPDKFPKGMMCDRSYFYNVWNTIKSG